MPNRILLRSTAVTVGVLVLLVGCSAKPELAGSYVAEGADALDYDLGPSTLDAATVDPYEMPAPAVSWADADAYIAVTTSGSSSCPSVPIAISWDGAVLGIELGARYPDQEACTADLNSHTVILDPPEGIDADQETKVSLAGVQLTLPAAQ